MGCRRAGWTALKATAGRSVPPQLTHTLEKGQTLEISREGVNYVHPLRARRHAARARSRFRPRLRPGQKGQAGAPASRSSPPENRRRVHQAHQGIPAGSAHHHRTGGPHAGVRHRAFAAQIPRTHSRQARRTDLRQGHLPLLRSSRQSLAARQILEDRPDRRRPRPGHPRHRRRGHHQGPRQVQGHPRQARRPAQNHRRAGARADQNRQAALLGQQRHPLARDRRPGNADRAGLPPDRRRDAVHPDHPQQLHHLHHAGDRSGWPRARSRYLLLQQEAPASACRSCTGASTCSTTTIATAWAST